jgi:hypothetical protein
VTRLGTGKLELRVQAGARDPSVVQKIIQTGCEVREAHHSPTSVFEVKNGVELHIRSSHMF